jgi:hypothetical protein
MPATLPDLSRLLEETAAPLIYRLAAYFTLSLLDDPAMLALAFC